MRRTNAEHVEGRSTNRMKGVVMVSTRWDEFDDLDAEAVDREIVRRRDRGKMPVGSESRARAACKVTWRSKALSRRLGRKTDGMRNRRLRKID
jgi:hypothetical protein